MAAKLGRISRIADRVLALGCWHPQDGSNKTACGKPIGKVTETRKLTKVYLIYATILRVEELSGDIVYLQQ